MLCIGRHTSPLENRSERLRREGLKESARGWNGGEGGGRERERDRRRGRPPRGRFQARTSFHPCHVSPRRSSRSTERLIWKRLRDPSSWDDPSMKISILGWENRIKSREESPSLLSIRVLLKSTRGSFEYWRSASVKLYLANLTCQPNRSPPNAPLAWHFPNYDSFVPEQLELRRRESSVTPRRRDAIFESSFKYSNAAL